MNFLSKVISTAMSAKERIIQVLRLGSKDIQEAEQVQPFGIDSNPIKNVMAVFSETSTSSEPVIIGYFNDSPKAEIGGVRFYSTNTSGAEQTYIYLRANGDIEIGGNTDNMVRYSALEIAFNQLRSDLNSLITTFNSHVHTGGTISGSTGTTATPGSPSTANISGAKIDKIKTL